MKKDYSREFRETLMAHQPTKMDWWGWSFA